MSNQQTGTSFQTGVPKSVRDHLLGKDHSKRHKFIFGLLISYLGVIMSHYFGHIDTAIVAIVGDHLGYGLHGLGFIPMYKAIEEGGQL